MSLRKKVMALCLAGTLMFALSACGPTKTTNQTPEEVVAIAIEKMNAAKSVSSTMNFDAKVVTGEQESALTATANADIIYQPLAVQIIGKSESQEQSPIEIKTYAQEENGQLVSYAAYGNQWIKQNIDKEGLLASIRMYDTKANAAAFLEKADQVKEISREDKVVSLEAVIPETDFQQVAESSQIFQMLGLSGLPAEYFNGMGDIKVTFDISELTGQVESYQMDLSAAAQTLVNNVNHYLAGAAAEGAKSVVPTVTVDKYVLHVVINSVDKLEKVTIPKEALEGAVDVAEQMKMNEQAASQTADDASKIQSVDPEMQANQPQ